MKNNIIVFHLDDAKDFRGGTRQCFYLAKELNEIGIENYIVLRKNSPLHLNAAKNNITAITIPYLFDWDIISAIMLVYKIKKINKNSKQIIIHSHTAHAASIAVLASFFINAKIVIHRRVDFKIKNNFLSRFKYRKADQIIAVSQAIKKQLIDEGFQDSNINLIYSSIDKDIFLNLKNIKRRVSSNKIRIGSLIALTPHKDPFNLIKAAKICLEKNKNLEFLVGGKGQLKKECENLIKKLKIEENFKLLGYVEDNIGFLKSIDIFVLPSKEEGLGSVLIEAMACGLPIVATNAGGIPELITHNENGLIVPKENPQLMAEAILKIAGDSSLIKKFSLKSMELSQNYTTKSMAKKTLEVYEKAIKNT
ncbi:MAG: glycosyltransferase family 4 protein [Elusimicrobiota bacterium]